MSSISHSRILAFIWLLVPTLLWSLFLHNIALCIDPLLFLAIEQRVSSRVAFYIRLFWGVVFTITLLWAWNIGPGTYLFYVREALPYTPNFILGMLGFALVVLIWFIIARDISEKIGGWRRWILNVGVALCIVKGLAAMEIIHEPAFRQHIRSPVLGSARLLFESVNANSHKVAVETPEHTFYSFLQGDKVVPSRVVLMLVESWGETQDALANIAGDIKSRGFQSVKYGFVGYRGSTLSGEFRELCAKYVQPSDGLMGEMANLRCAPMYLHDKGFRVMGFHGYQASFYARSTFWARFGIDNQMFADQFKSQRKCPGPFPGVCDENLIQKSIDMLDDSAKPSFVYMLTLSSHEPLDPVTLESRGAYFNEVKVIHPTQIVTRRAVSTLVSRLEARRNAACTLVYVVGDHQPPSASARGNLFEPGKVPYLAFTQGCLAGQR